MIPFDVSEFLEARKMTFIDVANQVWSFAETKFEEVKSADLLCTTLIQEGFEVERGIADMDTAFIASYGRGDPVIGVLCEYDALSGMSQQSSVAQQVVETEGGNGHGCGHNLFAAGSVAAAVAIREYLDIHGESGTIRLYGCPAEEGGSGKSFLARAGVFDDLDFALAWHPSTMNYVVSMNTLANAQVVFKFKGKSAHASVSPHLGRSALDAVELMNVGVNYLREHINPNTKISYAITDAGGNSPNVVQANASVLYLIRAPHTPDVLEVLERVRNVAKGAALMTGTEVELVFDKACSNLIPNQTLERELQNAFASIGVPRYTEQELALASEFTATLPQNTKENEMKFLRGIGDEGVAMYEHLLQMDLADGIVPYIPSAYVAPVSTDVGDVSWIVPTAQVYTACWALGTPAHSWQAVAQGTTSYAHKGMIYAAKILAAASVEIIQNPSVITNAKEELQQRLAGQPYVCPIPDGVRPGKSR